MAQVIKAQGIQDYSQGIVLAFDFLGGEGFLAVFAEVKLDLPVLFLAGASLDDVFAGAINAFLNHCAGNVAIPLLIVCELWVLISVP